MTSACGRASAQAFPDLSGYPWLYLRGGKPLQADKSPLELIAVGDLMLGRNGEGLKDPFTGSAAWLGQANLALGNLEGVLGDLPPVGLNLELLVQRRSISFSEPLPSGRCARWLRSAGTCQQPRPRPGGRGFTEASKAWSKPKSSPWASSVLPILKCSITSTKSTASRLAFLAVDAVPALARHR